MDKNLSVDSSSFREWNFGMKFEEYDSRQFSILVYEYNYASEIYTSISFFRQFTYFPTLRAFSTFYFVSRYNANVEMFRTTRITHS